jgi:pimeloyl-ACP methyl ester carboxylesterase
MWTGFGYVDKLQAHYTVILMDSRGHGKSDKPYTPAAYRSKHFADDVIAVLDEVGIQQAHYWGFSLNGYTGFVLAKYYPQRLLSLIIGGASPYNTSDPNQPDELLAIAQKGVDEGADAAIAAMKAWAGGSISAGFEQRLRNTDFRAMVAMLTAWPHEPGVEDVLSTMTMPSLVFIGERDEPDYTLSEEYVKQMPNAVRFVLPGLSHTETMQAIDLLLPRVLDFLTTGK